MSCASVERIAPSPLSGTNEFPATQKAGRMPSRSGPKHILGVLREPNAEKQCFYRPTNIFREKGQNKKDSRHPACVSSTTRESLQLFLSH